MTRLWPWKRRWPAVVALVAVLLVTGITMAWHWGYPALVRWAIRDRLHRLEKAWGQKVTVGTIEAGWGWVKLKDLKVRGGAKKPGDVEGERRAGLESPGGAPGSERSPASRDPSQGCPLLQVSEVDIGFDPLSVLSGDPRLTTVEITGPLFCLRRRKDGTSNFATILEKLRKRPPKRRRRLRVRSVVVADGSVEIRDDERGILANAESFASTFVPGDPVKLRFGDVTFRKIKGPSGLAEKLSLTFDLSKKGRRRFFPTVEIAGGRLSLHPRLFLTQLEGTVAPRDNRPGITLNLKGGYAGAAKQLWRASGWMNPGEKEGDLKLVAQEFTLDKLTSWLKTRWGQALVGPKQTMLSGGIRFHLREGKLRFAGSVRVTGLSIEHPKLAKERVRDLDFSVSLKGAYDSDKARIHLKSLELRRKGVSVVTEAKVTRLDGNPRIEVKVEVPRVLCASLLKALPEAVFPHVKRFKVRGHFSMGLRMGVDFDYLTLSSVNLGGHVHHEGCRVVHAPEKLSASRLRRPFEHVATDGRLVTKVWVGPKNPDFVPLEMVSRHVVNSLLTTEDSRFFKHHGFIHREFRSALARNLIAGKFKYGASSISMQFVKNVMLNREKTLSRKLEELILTAYVERHLGKKRLMEIYLNVIEFGPGIYGIGHAARHYFGKPAALIEPQEAAFLSTLLPSPKKRYRHFCRGQVTKRWRNWMDRILKIMYDRHRLTKLELDAALATPLVFSRAEFSSRWHCMQRIKKYLRGGRPRRKMRRSKKKRRGSG